MEHIFRVATKGWCIYATGETHAKVKASIVGQLREAGWPERFKDIVSCRLHSGEGKKLNDLYWLTTYGCEVPSWI